MALGGNYLLEGGSNASSTFLGTFTGTGGLAKVGTGTWTLDGSVTGGPINLVDVGSGELAIGDLSHPGVSLSVTHFTVDPGATLAFQGSSSAGTSTIDVFAATPGVLIFTDTASAGTAMIVAHGDTTTSSVGGSVFFEGSSTAAFSTITATGGTKGGGGGFIEFTDNATAGHASIVIDGAGDTSVGSGGGSILFKGNATGGNAAITLQGGSANGAAGAIGTFTDSSTAGSANILVLGGNLGGVGSTLDFTGGAGAATSTITVGGGGAVSSSGGLLIFQGNSSAQNASITIAGGPFSGVVSGGTGDFTDSATAGSAKIQVLGGSAGAIGGTLGFHTAATAGTATIDVFGSSDASSAPGVLTFTDTASAGTAMITAHGNDVASANGGNVFFLGTSSAAFSTLTATGGTHGGSGGDIQFDEHATAGNAIITVGAAGDSTAGSSGGEVIFNDSATAANATITVAGGTVTFTGGSTAGNATIDSAKLVQFEGGADGGKATYVGNTGSTLSIGGVSNAGGPLPSGGSASNTLNIGSIAGDGTVALGAANLLAGGNNASTVFLGTETGTGDLVKVGSGLWILDGSNSGGPINLIDVGAGELRIGDATHPGASFSATAITVDASATLSGHGTLAGALTNNGTVIPGGSIGTMTLSGSYATGEAGTLGIEVNPATSSELKVVGSPGTAAIDGTLHLSFDTGNYKVPRLYTFLTATGAISKDDADGFDAVTTTGLPPGTPTPNVVAVGPNTLDLVLLPGGALGSTGIPSIATSLLGQSQDVSMLIFRHLQDARGTTASVARAALAPQLAYAGLPDQLVQGPSAWPSSASRLWLRPFGRFASTTASGVNAGFDEAGGGVVGGLDHAFGNGLLLGVADAFAHDDVTTSASGSKGSIDSWRVSAYASWQRGAFAIDAQGGYAHDSVKLTRGIDGSGTAGSTHAGDEVTAAIEMSRRLRSAPAAPRSLGWDSATRI